MSKVTVRIYGQEYTIAGERSEDEIKEIAAHVDEQMKAISKAVSDTSAGSLAVLSAVNISDQYFAVRRDLEKVKTEKEKIEADAAYYMSMWEKSKKNTRTSKDNVSELRDRIRDDSEKMQKLRDKCTEYENSFFDLQMENIKLKTELDSLDRKSVV